ncbi:hypothetical protein L1987_52757 [Smallanthus sonchifolius]|uniref:Uncharacterized protein n=1 Tax=Smallanthus sonchifolius TaxID=185202 RepID=A0ACB9EU46_9ASTR|nr:hypothetical protein L1987_52757 [Smallanthus sonchifolius]
MFTGVEGGQVKPKFKEMAEVAKVGPAVPDEPGLRGLLCFFMGLYFYLNRGDVNPNAQELNKIKNMVAHMAGCL